MSRFKIGDRIVVSASATSVSEEFRGATGTVVEISKFSTWQNLDTYAEEELIGFILDDDTARGFVWHLPSCHLDRYRPFDDNQSICEFINEF